MTHTITIQMQNDHDFILFRDLAKRLGLPVKESHDTEPSNKNEQHLALNKFMGSWQGEETADELEQIIYSARNDKPRDIDL